MAFLKNETEFYSGTYIDFIFFVIWLNAWGKKFPHITQALQKNSLIWKIMRCVQFDKGIFYNKNVHNFFFILIVYHLVIYRHKRLNVKWKWKPNIARLSQ